MAVQERVPVTAGDGPRADKTRSEAAGAVETTRTTGTVKATGIVEGTGATW